MVAIPAPVARLWSSRRRVVIGLLELAAGHRDRTMIRVTCSAIPIALIESELFGREKGAFTGALTRQGGRFEIASGSTIFFDEIGDLPNEVQVKAAARARGAHDRAAREPSAHSRGRAHHRGHAPRPAARGQRRQVPRGPGISEMS
jgi:hypothetical protein